MSRRIFFLHSPSFFNVFHFRISFFFCCYFTKGKKNLCHLMKEICGENEGKQVFVNKKKKNSLNRMKKDFFLNLSVAFTFIDTLQFLSFPFAILQTFIFFFISLICFPLSVYCADKITGKTRGRICEQIHNDYELLHSVLIFLSPTGHLMTFAE